MAITSGFTSPVQGTAGPQRFPGSWYTAEDAEGVIENYFPGWEIYGPSSNGADYGVPPSGDHNPNGWGATAPGGGATFVTVPASEGNGNGNVTYNSDAQVVEEEGLFYIDFVQFTGSFVVTDVPPDIPPGGGDSGCSGRPMVMS